VNVFIFTGPTISPEEANAELKAIYLPPAAEGDVYRVALHRPQVIGIIDGYFQSVPTVRHKEILWAMSHGIHVFGSASMGALRAAELLPFGMEGVGAVFELYRDGILEDDDEVAVAHGSAETGFVSASEAMVNIRQTLRTAERVGIISTELRVTLEKIGKELFYPDRNYSTMLRHASENESSEAELTKLRQWLPNHRVNQKREDALLMLRVIRDRLEQGLRRKTVSYYFEQTAMWQSAQRQAGELRFDRNGHADSVTLESLLDELRLEESKYKEHRTEALQRFFALREAERLRLNVDDRRKRTTEAGFRQERDLADVAALERWMKNNDLSEHQFDTLMIDEAHVKWVQKLAEFASRSCLPEQLRLSGDYPRLAARVIDKDRMLQSIRTRNPRLESIGLTYRGLLEWYFEKVLGKPVPSDIDKYTRDLGFANPDAFRRALLKEYLYRGFERQNDTLQERSG
jgi:hypothetical protein